jgi:hypothetical protein
VAESLADSEPDKRVSIHHQAVGELAQDASDRSFAVSGGRWLLRDPVVAILTQTSRCGRKSS